LFKKNYIFICILFFLTIQTILFSSPFLNRNIISLDEKISTYDISGNLLFYHDKSNALKLSDILKPSIQEQFYSIKINPPVFTFSNDSIWGKFTVNNQDLKLERYIYIDYYNIQKLLFYIPDIKGNYHEIKSGKAISVLEQTIHDRMQIIPIQLFKGENTIYFKINSTSDSYEFPAYLVDGFGLASLKSKNNALLAIFATISTMLILINLIIFFILRDKSYLYFVINSISFTSLILAINGIPQYILMPDHYKITYWIIKISAIISFLSSLLFAVYFLNIRNKSYKVYKVLMTVFWAAVLITVLTPFFSIFSFNLFYSFVILCSLFILGFSLKYFKSDSLSRYFIFAWGNHLVLLILFSLVILNFTDTHIRITHLMIGNNLGGMLLSFALGQKFKIILQEKKELEKKLVLGEKREESLKVLADLDPLTGIYNRRKLDFELLKLTENIDFKTSTFSYVLIDLDHFKKVNDDFGHDMGDHVLIQFCHLVKESTRKSDIFCRYGGEEFVLILNNTKINDAKNVAENLRKRIYQKLIIGKKRHVTVSIGISEFKKGDNLDSIFKRADSALYKAKNNGRNQVVQGK